MRKQTATVFYYGRFLAFTIASTAMLFAAGAVAAEQIKIGRTGNALGTMQLFADAFGKHNPDVKVTVLPSLGCGVGIKAAAKGALDIAVGSRPLTENERKLGLMQSEQTC